MKISSKFRAAVNISKDKFVNIVNKVGDNSVHRVQSFQSSGINSLLKLLKRKTYVAIGTICTKSRLYQIPRIITYTRDMLI